MSSWPEYTGDSALVPITRNPRTPQVADEYGNPLAYGTTDNADPSGNFPIDSRIVEFIEYGVLNGSFGRGPADANHDITDINPLPDWTGPTSVSGGSITAQWVVDASSPSGYNLQFTVNAGAASDEVYFEQIVPIGGTRSQQGGHYIYATVTRVTASNAGFRFQAKGQYLDSTAATIGSAFSTATAILTSNTTFIPDAYSFATSIPSTARFLRIRLHIDRNTAGATDTATVTVSDVRTAYAQPVLLAAEQTTPGSYGPGTILQAGGILQMRPNGVASTSLIYVSDADGVQLWSTSGLVAPLAVQEITAAVTPDSGWHGIYAKASDSKLYSKDDGGTEYKLSLVSGTDYYGSGASPTFATVTTTGDVELGNASDTTLHRVSAGVVSIEGTNISVVGHGIADHADVTRIIGLMAADAKLDSGTASTLGTAPDIIPTVTLADAATQGVYWALRCPSDWTSGTLSFRPVWAAVTTDGVAHTVQWSLDVKAIAGGQDVTAAGTTVTYTGASAARTANIIVTGDTLTDSTVTPSSTNDLIRVSLRRIGADASDTLVSDVKLLELRMSYTASQ